MVSLAVRRGFVSSILVACVLLIGGPDTAAASARGGGSGAGAPQLGLVPDESPWGGVPGFFWLPPIARPPPDANAGEFVPGLEPVVTIERLPLASQAPVAVFTTTSGRNRHGRVTSDGHTRYTVLWDTKDASLDPAAFYRIRVELQGFELGHADVDVVRRMRDLPKPDRDEVVPLLGQRVLPIAFRIERDALRCVGVVCEPVDQCHVAACDPFTGSCTSPVKPDGTGCDDGNACTRADSCLGGVCTGASPVVCTALDQCHEVGVCDPATGACTDPVLADGVQCNDGDACSRSDACQQGVCVGGNRVVCTAQDQCHDPGTCDPATGVCSNPASPDGTPCIDGDYCTSAGSSASVVDACSAGECRGSGILCDDGDPCTQNGCDPGTPGTDGVTGCVYVPDETLPGCTIEPPEAVVAIVGLTPATDGFFVNQRLSFSVRLSATADRTDYDLEFLLYPFAAPDDPTEHQAVPVGTREISLVTAGENEYWVELEIPKTLPPGRWGVAVHEYPTSEAFFPGPNDTPLVLDIEGSPGQPVLDLTTLEVTQAALLVDPDSTVSTDPALYRDAPFAANLQVVSQNYPATAVPVTAHVIWNGAAVPLRIWDPALMQWTATLVIDALDADAPTGLYLELALAEADAAPIREELGDPENAAVVITVNESGSVVEAQCVVDDPAAPVNCRHTAEGTALLYAAPPAPVEEARLLAMTAEGPQGNTAPLRYEKSWSKSLGNSWMRAGVAFAGYAQLSKDGYEASARGNVPVSLLGFPEFDFVDATATAGALVVDGARVYVAVRVLGLNVFEPVDLGGDSVEKDLGELLPSIQKEKSFSKTVIVYVVPLTFKLGASAEIGLEGAITASLAIGATSTTDLAALSLSGGPYAKADGFGEAALGVAYMSAGARVTVAIVDAHLTATATGTLTLTKREDNALPLEIQGGLSEVLAYDTSFLNGRVGLTVTYPTLRWCKKWWIWYPCGFQSTTKEAVLCSWPGFSYGGDLLSQSQELFTIDLCTPTTSCGGICETIIDNGCRPEVCTCAAGQTCEAGVCVGPPPVGFPFAGLYYPQIRWGGSWGTWMDATIDSRAQRLEITADGRVYRGGVPIAKAVFTDNRLTWPMESGNDTKADIVFLDGSSNTYIWGPGGRQGILFEGYIQSPGEGILDYRGVRTCVPSLTCEGRCGPLFDGCDTIECGPCPPVRDPTGVSSAPSELALTR